MTVILEQSTIHFLKDQQSDSLTIDLKKTINSCCAVALPMAYPGTPRRHSDAFLSQRVDGVTVYFPATINAENDCIRVEVQRLLGRQLLAVHGVAITR